MLTLIASKKNAAQVSLPALQAAFSAALIAAGIQRDMAASLKLSDDKGIQKLNATYLGNDSPTDVLSFENAYIDPETGQEYLGDGSPWKQPAPGPGASGGTSAGLEMLWYTAPPFAGL